MTLRRRRVLVAIGLAVVAAVALWFFTRSPRPVPRPFAALPALPAGAVVRIGSPLFAPASAMHHARGAPSPDGRRTYTLDAAGELRAWDVDRGAGLWQVTAHAQHVPPTDVDVERRLRNLTGAMRGRPPQPTTLAVSPDGAHVATAAGAQIRVFDADAGHLVAERRTVSEIQWVGWTADGRSLLFFDERALVLWDPIGDAARTSEPFPEGTTLLRAAPEGGVLLTVQETETAAGRLVHLDAGLAVTSEHPLPRGLWPSGGVDPQGRVFALWRRDGAEPGALAAAAFARGWYDPSDGSRTEVPPGDTAWTLGTWLLPSGKPSRVRVEWNWKGAAIVRSDAAPVDGATVAPQRLTSGAVDWAVLAEDESRIAFSELGRLRFFDLGAGSFLHGDQFLPSADAFTVHPDGRRLFVGAADGALAEVEVETGRVLRTWSLGGGPPVWIVASADGRWVAGTCGVGRAFRLDLTDGTLATWSFAGSQPVALAVQDGRVLLASSGKSGWQVLDVESGAATPLSGAGSSWIGNVVFSHDGAHVRGDVQAGNRVWDTRTGDVSDASPTFPPRLSAGTGDGGTVVLDLPSTPVVPRVDPSVRLNPWMLSRVAATASLAAISDGATIHVVTVPAGTRVATFQAPDGAVVGLGFAGGGRLLVSGHDRGTLLVWRIPD